MLLLNHRHRLSLIAINKLEQPQLLLVHNIMLHYADSVYHGTLFLRCILIPEWSEILY